MSVTIKDVAKRANVAPSTVSRVISDSDKISEKTKQKVRKVMEEMNYHLNHNARVLVQKSTQTIGIVMKHSANRSLHNPFFPEVLRGMSSYCHKQNYSLLLTTGNSEEAIYQEVVNMVQGKRVDGVIVLYSKKEDKVVPFLQDCNIPFVVIGKPQGERSRIMFVDNDNTSAAKEAAMYLIQRGHKRISFIGDEPEYQVVQDRLAGYYEAMKEHNLVIREEYVQNLSQNVEETRNVIEKMMNIPEPPTAIISSADVNAILIMSALRELDYNVPKDISIISFNNTIISQLSNPSMTSVDIQTFQLGFEAAKCVIESIQDTNMFTKSVIIPTVIEERDSTGYNKKED
ncbi:LacI family transcriptional regulator [Oceanobacillus piezotolerans]|uniref:LacI family transcriptional regulator n=1 Tax=Oceanobacillus piezotolerans TaxID=2448030 RepID=A0A498D8I3_9BACI|nr:LacI family DNA-binding transcriptional regulator [Oceanobacillus piezotolerans]RLL46703.1 LacI family transcriptional regulator [Oceanobacillus piezotolerans]